MRKPLPQALRSILRLPRLRRQLEQDLSEVEYREHKGSAVAKVRSLLQSVLRWTEVLSTHRYKDSSSTPDRCIISEDFKVVVLGLHLSILSTAKKIWELPSTAGFRFAFYGNNHFHSRLLENGWCPYDVQYLKDITMDGTYYLGSFYPARAMRVHEGCDIHHCEADIYRDSSGYKNRHTEDIEDCNCAFYGPSTSDLLGSFGCDGGYPLITVHKNGFKSKDGPPDVEVIQFSQQKPVEYIALSYVWADGLGNPTGNTLPSCQLLEIQRVVNSAYYSDTSIENPEPVPFWVDTLCVPVVDNNIDYRKLAIQRMRSTYQNAKKVLVLDKEVLAGSKIASPRERIARIVLSTWMRRLWTFQEGFLAQELIFQFQDGSCSLEDIYRAEETRQQSLWSPGGISLAALCYGPMSLSKSDFHPERIFTHAFDGLQNRSTTRAGDETLCLAVIMGIDPLPLLNIVSREALNSSAENKELLAKRMQLLLQLMRHVPPGVMFLSENRLAQDGFKWAPSMLLGLQVNENESGPLRRTYMALLHRQRGVVEAKPSNMGEVAESGGLMVSMLAMIIGPCHDGRQIGSRFKVFHQVSGRPTESYEVRIIDNGEARENGSARRGDSMAILMDERAVAHEHRASCETRIGALVSLRGNDGAEYKKVDFVCRVMVSGCQKMIISSLDSGVAVDELFISDESDLERGLIVRNDPELYVVGKWHIF